jgi:hypothetical protein
VGGAAIAAEKDGNDSEITANDSHIKNDSQWHPMAV